MPAISTIGTGGTYTTLAAWIAAEGGSDYGVGNPAVGEFLELVNESVAVTGVFVRGYILRAQAGLELNKSTLVGVGNQGDTRPNVSTAGVVAAHENIIVSSSTFVATSGHAYTDCYIQKNMSVTTRAVTLTGCIGKGMARFLNATAGNANAIANNCTAIDNTGSFAFVRFKVTNCVNIGGAAQGFAAAVAGSDYNASDDTTAPGANSLQNRTTADLVNYAGGDYRTAAASALATAGSGGAYMGFALEAASGITVTEATASYNIAPLSPIVTLTGAISVVESTASYNLTSLNPTISLTGVVSIVESTTNYNYSSNNPAILLTGVVSIVESTANYNYSSNNPTIDFTGLVSIDEQLVNVNYQTQNPTITLTSHAISIIESTASYQVDSFNPAVLLTPEPIGIVSTLCFNGKLFSLENNGTVKEIDFNGDVYAIEFNAELQEIIFNGFIDNQENNGYLKNLEFNGTIQTNC